MNNYLRVVILYRIAIFVLLVTSSSSAALYQGNGSGTGGGAIGNGSLSLSDHGGTIFATINRGTSGNFNDILVLFIDTHSGSGFANTSSFSDTSSGVRRAISGLNGGGARATAIFASGFHADYAIALGVDQNVSIYHLLAGNDLGPGFIRSRPLSPNDVGNSGTYTFNVDWADIGLTSGSGFTFESTYITQTGSRYLESYEATSGAGGFNTITFGNYDTYGVLPVPEPVNAALALFGGVAIIYKACGWARRRFP